MASGGPVLRRRVSSGAGPAPSGDAADAGPPMADAGPLMLVISGPSGVGKDSVLSGLKERGVRAHITVTATTRPRRGDGPDDYLFLSEEAFDQLLAEDGLLEHATVYNYHYGVPKAPVAEALGRGEDVLMRVDVQGAATIKKLVPGVVLVFLAPPSLEDLEDRLRDRSEDGPEATTRRLDEVGREMARVREFDYVVVNERDRLDQAVDEVLAIMAAERCRVGRERVEI